MSSSVPEFHKSSYSQPSGGNCVEVARSPHDAAVRDSKHPGQGHITFPAAEWRAFIATLGADEI
ncbi:hypothetical protein HNR23_004252 [Nocardiopsis mwathae]|uniref:DUF397 domain-containing protein n=1 Tax=Nocardiopsis mwathae TaxID=1472723 RepID=A0A7W9YL60_9ACTN|nr:DUF397 domain-containing protein [Nocardiopsis mwathae]MBB6174192.1 hypothetical protein [Nocardiopsis mwathae]